MLQRFNYFCSSCVVGVGALLFLIGILGMISLSIQYERCTMMNTSVIKYISSSAECPGPACMDYSCLTTNMKNNLFYYLGLLGGGVILMGVKIFLLSWTFS
jgi:hypothetical protein